MTYNYPGAFPETNDEHDEHIVQLFDSPESAADAVAVFAREGLAEGATVVIVMTADHWAATCARLEDAGVDPDKNTGDGKLIYRDSATMLEGLMRGGSPHPDLFRHTIGGLVGQAHQRGALVRVYGDMVDRLAERGDFNAAAELEQLWNGLHAEHPFTLLCGYSAVHFGNPRSADSLSRICGCHSHVRSNPRDILGTFLLKGHQQEPSHGGVPPRT